jgi:hypothetical protein
VLLGVNLAIRQSNWHSSQSQLSNSLAENRKSLDDAAAVMGNLDRGNAVITRCRHVLIRFTKSYDASGKNSKLIGARPISDIVP